MSSNSPNSIPLSSVSTVGNPPLTPSPLLPPPLTRIDKEDLGEKKTSATPSSTATLSAAPITDVVKDTPPNISKVFLELFRNSVSKKYEEKTLALVSKGLLRRPEMTFLDPCSTEFITEKLGEYVKREEVGSTKPPSASNPTNSISPTTASSLKEICRKNLITKLNYYNEGILRRKFVYTTKNLYYDNSAIILDMRPYTSTVLRTKSLNMPTVPALLSGSTSETRKTTFLSASNDWETLLSYVEVQSVISGFGRIQTEEVLSKDFYLKQVGLSIIRGGLKENLYVGKYQATLINMFEVKEGSACALTYLIQDPTLEHAFLHTRWILSYEPFNPYWRVGGIAFLMFNYWLNPLGVKINPEGSVIFWVKDGDSKPILLGEDLTFVLNKACIGSGLGLPTVLESNSPNPLSLFRAPESFISGFFPASCLQSIPSSAHYPDGRTQTMRGLCGDAMERVADKNLILLSMIRSKNEFLQNEVLTPSEISSLESEIVQTNLREGPPAHVNRNWGRAALRNVFMQAIRSSSRATSIVTTT